MTSWWQRLLSRPPPGAGPVAEAQEATLASAVDPGNGGRLATAFAVGATLVEGRRRHDRFVDMDGSHQTRPVVGLRDWRKPLPTRP